MLKSPDALDEIKTHRSGIQTDANNFPEALNESDDVSTNGSGPFQMQHTGSGHFPRCKFRPEDLDVQNQILVQMI